VWEEVVETEDSQLGETICVGRRAQRADVVHDRSWRGVEASSIDCCSAFGSCNPDIVDLFVPALHRHVAPPHQQEKDGGHLVTKVYLGWKCTETVRTGERRSGRVCGFGQKVG
jgi:hypothetical protein